MNFFKISVIAAFVAVLAGCSSPPEPPQPTGERIAVNPQNPQPVLPKQPMRTVIVDDLPSALPQPQQVTPVDPSEFDRIKYRK